MLKHALRLAGVIALGLASAGASLLVSLPAGASQSSVASAPAKGLLTAGQAKALGFTKTATKVQTSNNTGVTGCSKGAQVAFENSAKKTGLISEVLVCKTPAVATALIAKEKKAGTALASVKPPKALGTSAIERVAQASTYVMYWHQGRIIELLALDGNIAATSSSSTTTSVPAVPPTAAQQAALVKAAIEQNANVK